MLRPLKFYILPFLLVATIGFGQDGFPIDSLFAMVDTYYPALRQKSLNEDYGKLVQEALGTNWYPKVNIGGSATYQSEVTEFSVPGSVGFPIPAKDQYKIGLELSQTLFDAGLNKAQKEIEKLNTITQENSLNSELLNIKGTVLDVAVSIMVAKMTLQQLTNTMENLKVRAKNIQTAIDNNWALPINKDEIEVEMLQLEQQMTGIRANIKTAYETLQILSGLPIAAAPDFDFQGLESKRTVDFELRPEVQNIDIALLNLEWQKKQLDRKALPKLLLFADGYFGRPGFNFLDNNFRLYGIGGVNLAFPITSLAYNRSVKAGLAMQKESFEVDKQKLTDQLSIQNSKLGNDISATLSIIEEDEKISVKRQNILKVSQNQFDNGVLLFSDFIEKLYNAQNAEINLEIHRLQLQQLYVKQKLLFND
ncbi:MAG: TolC family protein [Maribacter sp.]|nr:TolC family protein [Maribacter sp.]